MKTIRHFFICLVALLGVAQGIKAEDYITDVMLIGGGKGTVNDLKTKYQGEGWQVIDKDLNAGAGGAYIFLLYKSEAGQKVNMDQKYITDLLLVDKEIAKDGVDYQNTESFVHNGRTYYKVNGGGDDNFNSYGRNLNHQAREGGDHIYLYYTREKFDDNRVLTSVVCNGTKKGGVGNMGSKDALDLNRNASGDYIYLHFDMTIGVTYKMSQLVLCEKDNAAFYILSEKDYKAGDFYKGARVHKVWYRLSDTGWDNEWINDIFQTLRDFYVITIETVVIDPSFADVRPKSCYCWFSGFMDLKRIDGLEYLNTSECTNMNYMFGGSRYLKTLDLRSFDVSKVTNADEMFRNCVSLTTIYCDKTWSINSTSRMFERCIRLKGVMEYNDLLCSGDMANPETGYFTGMWKVNLTSPKLTVGNTTPYTNETVTISAATGHKIEEVTVIGNRTGNTVKTTNKGNNTWTFKMPAEIVTVNAYSGTVLQDDADNSTVLEQYDSELVNATLAGRTLTTDGTWNTLCLPFSLTQEQMADSPLAGANIKEMDNSASGTSLADDGVLTLKFKDVSSIEAGKPYIVKYGGGNIGSADIVNPVFKHVTISATEPTAVTSSDGKVEFVGQFSPFAIDLFNKNEILFLSDDNRIGYVSTDASLPRELNNFRAHFSVKPIGDGSAAARNIRIDFGDDDVTGVKEVKEVKEVKDNSWYSIDGRRLNSKPTAKGVYINNGRSVIIK